MTIEHGSCVAVEEEPLGDELAKDYTAGASVIEVRDLSDFPEFGGSVALVGETVAYDRVDEDASTILLSAPTTLAHSAEEPVLMDPPVKRYVAHVQIDDVAGEVVLADLSHPLKMYLPLGSRDPGAEESVVISNETGVWEVVDVLGVLPGLVGGSLDIPDVDQPGFHVGSDGSFAVGGVDSSTGAIVGKVVGEVVINAALDALNRILVLKANSITVAYVDGLGGLKIIGGGFLEVFGDPGDAHAGVALFSGAGGVGESSLELGPGGAARDVAIERTAPGEVSLVNLLGGGAAFGWGGGSGSGFSALQDNDVIRLARKGATPAGTPGVDEMWLYFRDDGSGHDSVFAKFHNGTDKKVADDL